MMKNRGEFFPVCRFSTSILKQSRKKKRFQITGLNSVMKEHLIRVNSVPSSSADDVGESVELRARGRGQIGTAFQRENDSPTWLGTRVLIDKPIKPGDTLNKISLQFSVSVADLKRANNLVNDQDVFALPSIKIPVSRFFADRLQDQPQVEPYRPSVIGTEIASKSGDRQPLLAFDQKIASKSGDRQPLLAFDESDEDSDEAQRKAHVNALLERTDANVAQVRGNLPSPGIETGAFHFVDATSPDTTMRNIWLLIVTVVLIFVVIPLLLTLLEEKSEAEAAAAYHRTYSSS
uniref:LysM domain-containing protein n=1 Tax=Panagrolaimus sp. JU765 TaxID=591449 RepID=A0AC34QY21_9BILA